MVLFWNQEDLTHELSICRPNPVHYLFGEQLGHFLVYQLLVPA